jgi:hypothetical protein
MAWHVERLRDFSDTMFHSDTATTRNVNKNSENNEQVAKIKNILGRFPDGNLYTFLIISR